MAQIKFGTDGWRAVIAEDFTFANVARVAQAAADYWKSEISNPQSEIYRFARRVVVGYDRRFLSDRFAQITADVLAGNDFQVILTPEPTPTPSVSFAVKKMRAAGGVMITASHNPPIFNGFKLKSYYGGSSDSETCQAVESFLDKNPPQFRTPNSELRISVQDVPSGALCRAEKTGGLQAHREIKTPFRA